MTSLSLIYGYATGVFSSRKIERASKHKALSYGHARKIEAQLQAEVSALTAQAGVDTESMLVVSMHITQATNDKQEVVPGLYREQHPAVTGGRAGSTSSICV